MYHMPETTAIPRVHPVAHACVTQDPALTPRFGDD
jgi:hypothetical protein